MVTVKEMLVSIGVPVCVVEGRLLGRSRRGRPPKFEQEKSYPGNRKTIKPNEWVYIGEAAKTLGISHERAILLIEKKELRPAVRRGILFVSIESVDDFKKKLSEIESNPDLKAALEPAKKQPVSVRPSVAPVRTDSPTPRRFVPSRLTREITVSERWVGSSSHDSAEGRHVDYESLRIIEYAPGKYGHTVEDVAALLKLHPRSIQSLIDSYKVEGDCVGRVQYIRQESLEKWFKKTRRI